MNIAELRKKGKKRKDETLALPDSTIEIQMPSDVSVQLPVPAVPPLPAFDATDSHAALDELIDEESFYINKSQKDDAVLKEFLCFFLGNEEYALDISVAREVIKKREITEVPKVADFIVGIISIRGNVVPVFDIKKLLGIESDGASPAMKFVLLSFDNEPLCIIIDRITQITKISVQEVEGTPMNVSGAKQEFIKGVAIVGGKPIRILDVEKIFNF